MARTEYGPRADYVGTGSLAEYTFDFKIKSLEHLIIGVVDDSFEETFRVRGDDTEFIESVDFDPTTGGGTVTLVDDLPTDHRLYILLADDEPLQSSEFKSKGDFTLQRFEDALDAVVGQVQRLAYLASRSLKLNDSLPDDETFDPSIPINSTDENIEDNANKVICVNETNDGLMLGPSVVDLAAQAAAAIAAAAASASSAAEAAQSVIDAGQAAQDVIDQGMTDVNTAVTAAQAAATAASASESAAAVSASDAAASAAAAAAAAATGGMNNLAAVGSAPNANGASYSAQTLTLQPADASFPGVMTAIAQSFAGVKTFINHILRASNASITAFAGGGQGSATPLTKDINRVTTVATNGDSVLLPVGVAGMEVVIFNDGASSLDVFPSTGETINALAADTAYDISASASARFICIAVGVWKTASGGAGALRCGIHDIADATSSFTVVFSSALADALYVVVPFFQNVTDADPIFLQGIITAKTVNGFTVKLNTATDTANYKLEYQVNAAI
jgi:hypothetical protein